MIPLFLTLKIQKDRRAWGGRFWIPLFLVWILLAPLVIMLLPFLVIAFLIMGLNPFRGLRIFWDIFCAIRGTHIEVVDGRQTFLIDVV